MILQISSPIIFAFFIFVIQYLCSMIRCSLLVVVKTMLECFIIGFGYDVIIVFCVSILVLFLMLGFRMIICGFLVRFGLVSFGRLCHRQINLLLDCLPRVLDLFGQIMEPIAFIFIEVTYFEIFYQLQELINQLVCLETDLVSFEEELSVSENLADSIVAFAFVQVMLLSMHFSRQVEASFYSNFVWHSKQSANFSFIQFSCSSAHFNQH